VLVAQYVDAAAVIFFMPAGHVKVLTEHNALVVQQRAAVVPTVAYLAESLNLLAPQVGEAPRHFCSSSMQHVASSVDWHVEPAQNNVPALHLCFLPSVHV
jgi:hypothetical protein